MMDRLVSPRSVAIVGLSADPTKHGARVLANMRKLGFEVPESYANFLLARNPHYNAADIYDKLVQRNIYVRYFELPGLTDKLRITVGTEQQNDTLLCALREILCE